MILCFLVLSSFCILLYTCANVLNSYLVITFVSDIAVFVLKRDVKLQPTNQLSYLLTYLLHRLRWTRSTITLTWPSCHPIQSPWKNTLISNTTHLNDVNPGSVASYDLWLASQGILLSSCGLQLECCTKTGIEQFINIYFLLYHCKGLTVLVYFYFPLSSHH